MVKETVQHNNSIKYLEGENGRQTYLDLDGIYYRAKMAMEDEYTFMGGKVKTPKTKK